MSNTVPIRSDLKIEIPTTTFEKATLSLSETGDLVLVDGKDKLAEQLIRSVCNEQTILKDLFNKKNVSYRKFYSLLTLILRNFKQNQINEVNKSDSNFSGFTFYRKASNVDEAYAKVSADPIIYKFVDTGLTNGITYNYGIAKIYNNVFETSYSEKLSIAPTQFTHKQEIVIGQSVVAFSGNGSITFYVDYNKSFKGSELLEKILKINIQQSREDPRRWLVNVIIEDFLGNQVSVASKRINPVTGKSV